MTRSVATSSARLVTAPKMPICAASKPSIAHTPTAAPVSAEPQTSFISAR